MYSSSKPNPAIGNIVVGVVLLEEDISNNELERSDFGHWLWAALDSNHALLPSQETLYLQDVLFRG